MKKFDNSSTQVETDENRKDVPAGRWTDSSEFVCGRGQIFNSFRIRPVAICRQRKLTFVSPISRLLTCVAAAVVVVFEVNAADQSVNLQYSPSATLIESPAEEATAFWERFQAAFDQNVDEQFADDFRPLNALKWSLKLGDRNSRQLPDRIPNAARHALSKSVVGSLREAALELPFMLWLKDHQSFLTDILLNSVGNVQEEAVSPLDLSYRLVERSWWQRSSESGGLRYGLRPFRTNPYAFMSLGIRDGDRLLLSGLVRYYFQNFADHRFEIALSLPLTHGFAIDIGTSYEFGRYGDEKRLAIKLFKELKTGGVMHIGLEAKPRPALLAGITFPL